MPRDNEGRQNPQNSTRRDQQPAQGAQDRQGKDRPQGKTRQGEQNRQGQR